ncbi:MAG: cupin [Desulfotomaculaceae bacterium]|nr:cupin [Desulfotomaculaceae bacterium]
MNETVKGISEGKIVYLEKEFDVENLDWNPHASFPGVYLKHLVKGESSDGKFSCHLIRIDNGFEISDHIHEDKWELHEVIGGVGKGVLAGKEIVYKLGVTVVVPEKVPHKIVADNGDVYLLAKFIPALI